MNKHKQRDKFGSTENFGQAGIFLLDQAKLLKGLISIKLQNRATKLKTLIAAIGQTAESIAILGVKGYSNDCIMLCRAFIERLINCCYLLVCDEDEFKNFKLHFVQKRFRKLNRSIEVRGIKIEIKSNAKVDKELLPDLYEALNKFTSKAGKERIQWTDKGIVDRIRIIEERSKVNIAILMLSKLLIYEDASEALHGTLYGCIFHYGICEPGEDLLKQGKRDIYIRQNLTLLFWQNGLMIHELISMLDSYHKDTEIIRQSAKNCSLIKKAIKHSNQ